MKVFSEPFSKLLRPSLHKQEGSLETFVKYEVLSRTYSIAFDPSDGPDAVDADPSARSDGHDAADGSDRAYEPPSA